MAPNIGMIAFIVLIGIVGVTYLIKAFGDNLEVILGCIALAVIVFALTRVKSMRYEAE